MFTSLELVIDQCLKYKMGISQNYKGLNDEIVWWHETKIGEDVPSLEVVEVVLVQCNLVDNQYKQKSEVLYNFTPNKCLFVKC